MPSTVAETSTADAFAEADRLFEEAASSESPEVLRSVVHENAGRSCFDQGRQMEALDHFARAIRLGAPSLCQGRSADRP